MNEVNLVGLPEELVNEVFPNAHVANIPEMNDEPRGYWLNKYKRLIRGMTAKRAKRFIS